MKEVFRELIRDGQTILNAASYNIDTFAKRIKSIVTKTIESYGLFYFSAVVVYTVVMMFDLYPSCLVCNNIYINSFGIVVVFLVYRFYQRHCKRCGVDILKTDKIEIEKSVNTVLSLTKKKVPNNQHNVEERTTMTFIFIWTGAKGGNVGHASLQLWNNTMTYISHWPAENLGKLGDPAKKLEVLAATHNLETDLNAEANYVTGAKKYPDILITIPDKFFTTKAIEDIAKYSDERLKSIAPRYKLKFENCADVVQEALKAGGFKLVNPIPRVLKLGLTAPTDIGDRIVYTFVMKKCHHLIRALHSVFEFSVILTYIYVTKVILYYLGDLRISSVAVPFIMFVVIFLFTVIRRND